jgi:lipopolysaccharide biosynthesis regulator YciM
MMEKFIGFLLVLTLPWSGIFAQESATDNFISEGIKLHDKGDYTGAIDLYKKALQLDKRSAHANYEMASSYLALKDFENTIKYCDKVIVTNLDYIDQSYILKGSALDLSGKPLEALNTYKQGLKKYSTNHLLYYNLAFTSFNLKEYKNTDEALEKALKINPSHASSHLLLGYSMVRQGHRVKAILALYNFLLLEPKGNRTTAALDLLEEQLKKGVKKDSERSVTLTIPGKKDDDEFYTAELMLGLLESSKTNETNKAKSASALFAENTNSFFTILGELKNDKKGFWWNFYVDYFYGLATNKHTEAFCYYITQSKDDAAYTKWVQDNLPKIESFSAWYTKYLHKF